MVQVLLEVDLLSLVERGDYAGQEVIHLLVLDLQATVVEVDLMKTMATIMELVEVAEVTQVAVVIVAMMIGELVAAAVLIILGLTKII
ncbi:hypothetical protein N8692_04980 [Flavobacteriales bacterium]|nr:hypothetical protein [Flavobacteriales bacterium]